MNANQDTPTPPGLGHWVGSLASAMSKGLNNELAPFGVTASQWAILATCYRGEANTVSGLARVMPGWVGARTKSDSGSQVNWCSPRLWM